MLKTNLLLLLILMVCAGCPSPDDDNGQCEDQNVDFTSLEEAYGCTNTPYEMELNLKDTYTVISSQEVFDSLVFGSCTPEIDYNTYDLIIGKYALRTGNISISYEAIEDCETNAVTLTVTFLQNETLEAPNLTYHILAPKLENVEALTVNIIETN